MPGRVEFCEQNLSQKSFPGAANGGGQPERDVIFNALLHLNIGIFVCLCPKEEIWIYTINKGVDVKLEMLYGN